MTPTPTEIDQEVVQRAQRGEEDGLRALVEAAYPAVRRWALVRTGDAADADDLTQDVMIQMIRRLDSYHGEARFSTWLYTVTRNAAADRFRKTGRRQRVLDDPRAAEELTPRAEPVPGEGLDRQAMAASVRAFFHELPTRQREVFDLVELQGLSSPEAGARLGIEPVSVRANLFKARRTLRARILASHPELAEDLS